VSKLKDFLTELATDPKKLGDFIHDPDAAMAAARLSSKDQDALRSGFPDIIHARLAGVPIKKAFQIPPPPIITMPPPP
jgi:hypothetical protein